MSGPRLGFVALGFAALAEERLAGVVRAVDGAARTVGRPLAAAAAPVIPKPLRGLIEDAIVELDSRGRSVAASGSERGNELAQTVADRVSEDPAVQKVVDNLVEHLQWRVVDAVLPVVLERLAAEPEQIRVIVQGQSIGMVEEITRAARAQTARGDDAVDRFVGSLLRRDPGRQRRIGRRTRAEVVDHVVPVDP